MVYKLEPCETININFPSTECGLRCKRENVVFLRNVLQKISTTRLCPKQIPHCMVKGSSQNVRYTEYRILLALFVCLIQCYPTICVFLELKPVYSVTAIAFHRPP